MDNIINLRDDEIYELSFYCPTYGWEGHSGRRRYIPDGVYGVDDNKIRKKN